MAKLALIITLVYSCLYNTRAFGQSPDDSVCAVSITGLAGLRTFSEKQTSSKGKFWGIEAAYKLNMTNNTSDWVKMMNVKDIDFAFSYRNLTGLHLTEDPNTKGFIGTAYSVVSRLEISLFQLKRIDVLLSPGMGFTYVTQTFYTNHNLLIGSHLNATFEMGLKTDIPINHSTKIEAGADLFHFSNTGIKLPNIGVNTLSATLGVVHNINDVEKPDHAIAFNIDRKSSIDIGAGIGHRGLIQVFQRKLSIADSIKHAQAPSHLNNLGFYVGYNYRLNSLISLKAATDIVYYLVTYDLINYLTTVQGYGTSEDKFNTGISLGGDLWLGRLAFEANYGYYLHFKYATTPVNFYYTFGAKYFFTPWAAFEAKVYLHGVEAQYTNFGVLFNVK